MWIPSTPPKVLSGKNLCTTESHPVAQLPAPLPASADTQVGWLCCEEVGSSGPAALQRLWESVLIQTGTQQLQSCVHPGRAPSAAPHPQFCRDTSLATRCCNPSPPPFLLLMFWAVQSLNGCGRMKDRKQYLWPLQRTAWEQ